MKARLVPIFFDPGKDDDFEKHLAILKQQLSDYAEFLSPVALGSPFPEAEGAIFPQFLGEAYRKVNAFKSIDIPILVITSGFGTVNMWDWEIVSFLREEGVELIAPYNLDQSITACKALGVKRELKDTTFLVFQDNPGEGFQSEIFKRFYWWEDQCINLLENKFGFKLKKKSFKTLGADAKKIPDDEAKKVLGQWDFAVEELTEGALLSAVKIYIALKKELEADPSVRSMGINCLNESRCSDTTPCLAWNMLYEEKGIIWGCEADLMVMITKYILHKSLGAPIMMTNIYPFLMGKAATNHEKILGFPEFLDEPENHLLLAHCGYFGVVPQSFSSDWKVRPKVLAIVDDNAHALDARMPEGKTTLAKLNPKADKMMVVEGDLKGYVQFPGSDCRNGAIVKVPDGHNLVLKNYSHHQLVMTGHWKKEIDLLGKVFNFSVDEM